MTTAQAEEKQEKPDPYARSRNYTKLERDDFAILTGNSNKPLAEAVARRLGTKLATG